MAVLTVETTDDIVTDSAAGTQIRPRIVALSDGGYVVTWGQSPDAWGARFDANGQKVGSDFQIPGDELGFIGTDLAADDFGNFYVVSSATATSLGVSGFLREIAVTIYDGSPQTHVLTAAAGDQLNPAIARLVDGSFVVAWNDNRNAPTDYGDIYARRLDSNGNPIGTDFALTTASDRQGWVGTTHGTGVSIAALSDGGYVVGWTNGLGLTATYVFRVFDSDGTPRSSEITTVSTNSFGWEGARLHGLAGGNFAVVFTEYNPSPVDPRVDVYDPDGTFLQTFRPNIAAGDDATSVHQSGPALTPLSDGRMFITWVNNEQHSLQGAIFSSDGTLDSNLITITDIANNNQRPSVAELSDGRIVVTWESINNGDWNIRSAVISSVTPNTAPEWTSAAAELERMEEDDPDPAGEYIYSDGDGSFTDAILNEIWVDQDGDPLAGIAITANAALPTEGVWQYSTDDRATWHDVGAISGETAALVLGVGAVLRFVPVADYNGTPGALTAYLIDDTYTGTFTDGATRVTADVSDNGGTTPFSDETRAIGIEVDSVNDAPVANDDPGFTAGEDDGPAVVGNALDNDSDPEGQALTAVAQSNVAGTGGGLFSITEDGQVTFDPNGEFEALNAGDTATTTFTYEAQDDFGDTTAATVTVTVSGADDGPTPNDDNLTGTPGSDEIDLLAGDDTYLGLGGDDTITGGPGADSLEGGDDDDTFVVFEGDLEPGESMDGGTHTNFDIVELRGGGNFDFTGVTLTDVEEIQATDTGGSSLVLPNRQYADLVTLAAGESDSVFIESFWIPGNRDDDLRILFDLGEAGVEDVFFNTSVASVSASVDFGDAGIADDRVRLFFVDDPFNAIERDYETLTQEYDRNGTIRFVNTLYDDGRESFATYDASGALTSTTIADGPANTANYETVTVSYENGVRTQSVVELDNGVTSVTTYAADGMTRLLVVSTDMSVDSAAVNYQTLTTTYNSDDDSPGFGLLQSRVTVFDEGQRYTEMAFTYDEMGTIESQRFTFPDGTVRENIFAGGAIDFVRVTNLDQSQIFYGLGGDDNFAFNDDGNTFQPGGDDTIYAGDGNDTVFGGSGDNDLWGQAGDDTFVFDSSLNLNDTTRVRDFDDNGNDMLDLTAFNITDLAGFQTYATQVGADVVVDLAALDHGTITLVRTLLTGITDDHFVQFPLG